MRAMSVIAGNVDPCRNLSPGRAACHRPAHVRRDGGGADGSRECDRRREHAWLPCASLTKQGRMMKLTSIFSLAMRMAALLCAFPTAAQDMMRHVDLTSPEMTSAEMTRADVEAAMAAATSARPADFTGKKLSGLDLSGLDLSGAVLRAARLIGSKLTDAKLDRAVLDQAWLLQADLSRASLKGASLFAAQMQRAKLDAA